MNFSKAELKQLIGDDFKNYEVVYEEQGSWFGMNVNDHFLKLVNKNTDKRICLFDIDDKEFSANPYGDDFDNELEAIKDFEQRVLALVSKKEHEQKIQSRLDKSVSKLNKVFKEYLNALNEVE